MYIVRIEECPGNAVTMLGFIPKVIHRWFCCAPITKPPQKPYGSGAGHMGNYVQRHHGYGVGGLLELKVSLRERCTHPCSWIGICSECIDAVCVSIASYSCSIVHSSMQIFTALSTCRWLFETSIWLHIHL